MSASDKKKLRKEERLAALTEKQQQAKKEAKKLKAMSISFIAVLAVILLVFGWMMVDSYLKVNGVFEKKTIVATIDGTDLNTVEFSYYYADAIDNYYQNAYSQYGTSTQILLMSYGLDITKPLNEQENPETGDTWANYFIEIALSNAKSDYALYNKAIAAGFDPNSEDVNAIVDQEANNLMWNGYFAGSVDNYLRTVYCNGATEEGYLNYIRRNAVAGSYYNKYMEDLTYTDTQISEYTNDRYNEFSSFSYNYYTISYTKYLNAEEGTKNEETGAVTYSEEQKNAAREAARKDAEALAACNSLEAFNLAIASLSFNKDLTTPAISTASTDVLYATLKEEYATWLAEADRKEFDVKAFPVETTTTVDGKEVKVVDSYNVIMYLSTNENLQKHGNVRHVLVQYEQSLDDKGNYTVTDDAKKAAKEEAEKLYTEWKEAGATKEAFIEMAKEHSEDPGVTENEGLYEDIHPSSEYLTEFRDWAVDPKRVEGDHAIVETSSGCHIMYFEGHSDETYRDYLVNTSMVNEDMEKWYDGILEAAKAELKDTSRLNKSMVISAE